MFHVLAATGLGLVNAAALSLPPSKASELFKRWDSQLCTCDMAGVAIPDSVTFQLPLENYRQDMCYGLINAADNSDAGQFCWNFTPSPNEALTLTIKPASGLQLLNADVSFGTTAQTYTSKAYSTSGSGCTLDAGTGNVNCIIPWTDISGVTALLDILNAMCPYGDREALILYMGIKAQMSSNAHTFDASPRPCDSSNPAYTTCDTTVPYFELTYRCTACPTCPSVKEYCGLGTAFGYCNDPSSTALNTLTTAKGCNRWGWYELVSYETLSTTGIWGPLYVGAGLNDFSKATNVGKWSAKASGSTVSVVYTLNDGYSLGEVHVDVRCSQPTTCAPGQYAYGQSNLVTGSFPTGPITITCPVGTGNVYLIIHAKVNSVVSVPAAQAGTFICPVPANTG